MASLYFYLENVEFSRQRKRPEIDVDFIGKIWLGKQGDTHCAEVEYSGCQDSIFIYNLMVVMTRGCPSLIILVCVASTYSETVVTKFRKSDESAGSRRHSFFLLSQPMLRLLNRSFTRTTIIRSAPVAFRLSFRKMATSNTPDFVGELDCDFWANSHMDFDLEQGTLQASCRDWPRCKEYHR